MAKQKSGIVIKYPAFIQMILDNSETPLRTMIVYTIISGTINAVLLSVFNAAANSAKEGTVNIKYLCYFGVSILIFFITKKYILQKSVEIVEKSIYHIRMRLLEKIRKCELKTIEEIGKADIFTRISQDANFISQSAAVIVNAFQACILVFFALIYIGFISASAFFVTITILGFGIVYFLSRQKGINEELRAATNNETTLYAHIDNLLDGFKEIKINKLKTEEFYDDITNTAKEGKIMKINSGNRFAVGFMFSEMVFYTLLGCIVFILPQFEQKFTSELTRLTAAILFIIGPLESIVTTIPLFYRANVASHNITALEEKVENAYVSADIQPEKELAPFESIDVRQAIYEYTDEEKQSTFVLGPIDFSIKKGEFVCIIGGNGSGKSTFLKVFSSLYLTNSGSIAYNGVPISEIGLQQYRSLFSVIFADFHLFPKIYGVPNLSKEKVLDYIKLMKLEAKTSFDGVNFTNVKLSTGQKKRLALICTLLEDKPFMILDEVTADQDPEFKKYFYQEILPDLKRRGKTLLLVSHDDRYFEQFDRVVKMEYGKILN